MVKEQGPQTRDSTRYLAEYAPLFIHSQKMRTIKEIVEEVADTGATILLRGESGVGKDVVARAIHAASSRQDRLIVKVNCAALPAELLESELFGHEKGAFTGAHQRKLGKFEFANKGTIFLDEIGELPRPLQAKLLHVLQDFEFSRIGGREVIRVDVRVIASTNRNLEPALGSGEFREDLYYRLCVVELWIPPLRERKEEIPALASLFLARFNQQYGRELQFSPETIALFTAYSWPGNVRELENIIRRLVVLGNVQQVHEEIIARLRAATSKSPPRPEPAGHLANGPVTVPPALGLRELSRRAAREAEQLALVQVLDRVYWNRAEAARILKVSYKTLLLKIAEFGLTSGHARRKS
jgi:two-component system response regulator AtoC